MIVVGSKWKAQARWQPDPALLLARMYHPAICEGTPAFDAIPPKVQELVRALHNQHQRWSHKPYFWYGLSDRLIAALNGYRFAAKLADCMMKRNRYADHGALGLCDLDWFCSFCAYLKGQDLLKKYADAWETGGWFSMVLSLDKGVCPADPEHNTIREVYDAMEAILKRLQKRNLMLGYVAWRSRSIYCSMIVHAVNNGLIATLVHFSVDAEWGLREMKFVPWSLTFGALAVLAVGLALIAPPRLRPGEVESKPD